VTVESATYIDDLVATNPDGADPKSEGDNHLRLIKSVLLASFPNVGGAVSATHTELNYVDGVTSAVQTQLDAKLPKAGGTMTGDIAMGDNDISGIRTATFNGVVTVSGTAVDWTAGLKQAKTLSGSVTLTFTAPAGPTSGLVLKVKQGSSSTYTVTWPATVKWPGGTAPTQTQIVNRVDVYGFYYDGANYFGSYLQNFAE
jgi:hypothetical protein